MKRRKEDSEENKTPAEKRQQERMDGWKLRRKGIDKSKEGRTEGSEGRKRGKDRKEGMKSTV
jgi:hypothetical protein